jgi:serralysin
MPNVTIKAHNPTGNAQVDALLSAEGGYWAAQNSAQPFSLTYSTVNQNSQFPLDYSSLREPVRGDDIALSDNITKAFDEAVAAWTNVANITITKITDTATQQGDIRLGASRAVDLAQAIDPDTVAYTYLPLPTDVALKRNGDIWLAPEALAYNYDTTQNSLGYFLLLSNLGHAIFGLENTSDFSGLNGNRLSSSFNNFSFTIMSDSSNVGVTIPPATAATLTQPLIYPTTPMPLDILAAQSIYGANLNYNAGNTTYSFGVNQVLFKTLWDGGGFDTIDWSNQSNSGLINLQPGSYSRLGPARFDGAKSVPETLAIAFNTTIESALGGNGNDTILGNDAGNFLVGNLGNDSVFGNNGTDLIYGNAGNDILYGNLETDYLYGGTGADSLYGGTGVDLIYGNSDGDLIYGNQDQDVLFGGSGLDTIYGGQGSDYIAGNRDDDVLLGNAGADTLEGGEGADRLYGGNDKDTLYGGDGNDALRGDGDDDIIYGAIGSDTLYGGDEEDLLYGGDGNDALNGDASEDTLYGGEGDDALNGGDGADVLDGGGGQDTLNGGNGDDTYFLFSADQSLTDGGDGFDIVYTQINYKFSDGIESGVVIGTNSISLEGNGLNNLLTGNERNNTLIGADGNDALYGGEGADTLDGGSGKDTLYGGGGDDVYILTVADTISDQVDVFFEDVVGGIDTIRTNISFALPEFFEILILDTGADEATGNSANNSITGNSENNLINGAQGDDFLIGGGGADTLVGGTGNDTIDGGIGIDIFRYVTSNTGNDIIQGYEAGIDSIQFGGGVNIAAQTDVGGNAFLTLSNGGTITVVGVDVVDLTII